MNELIDFSSAKINPLRMYGGANGTKIGVAFEGETYMLKFAPKANKNNELSYANSCISEYVACHIVKSLGVEVQETQLGTYQHKMVVACKDFQSDGFVLSEFAHLKNTIIDSEQNGYGTELNDILDTISQQQIYSPAKLEDFFWRMFVIDAFLGNFDRHNDNWGFLINHQSRVAQIAPIYDCGSCLYPQIDESKMKLVMDNPSEMEERIYTYPTSAIKNEHKKINYFQFLVETKHEGCIRALSDISSSINLNQINEIIDNTPGISELHQAFLKFVIKERKEKLIDLAMQMRGGQRK